MSWFDTKSLNWAKTALKDAVASIDKALDIQDDQVAGEINAQDNSTLAASSGAGSVRKQKLPGAASREVGDSKLIKPDDCNTLGTAVALTPATVTSGPSTWGSFTGSFFDNPNTQETITSAPRTSAVGLLGISGKLKSDSLSVSRIGEPSTRRLPIASQSGEPFSSSTSNTFALQSSTTAAGDTSYVESPLIAVDVTAANSSEGICTESIPANASLPDSIVMISEKEDYETEEDAISSKTVVSDTMESTENEKINVVSTSLQLSEDTVHSVLSTRSCSPSHNMIISLEETHSESHPADSDSTQSFEDVQMQISGIHNQYMAKAQGATSASGDHTDQLNIKTNSSPHNSNDEMETTTSSDIEIISNPNGNGDSSSTNSTSRTSPLKLKKLRNNQAGCHPSSVPSTNKGHFREPSEISILSEDSQSELDKLLHRISELNEALEARELRLLHLERQNIELQERNSEIEVALEMFKSNSGNLDSAEGYTQRLSALEKKFQGCIRERDALRIQIKDLKDELQLKIPKEQLVESNAMIVELRLEGEKLSKEILQHSNIIKKLRAKEKSSDAQLKKDKEEIASLTEELERLKKTLNAKEEVERTQIEAVHKMSFEKRKLEEENSQQHSKLEDLQSRLSTLQSSFEAAKLELQNRTRLHSDLARTAEKALVAKNEHELMKAENQELTQQLKVMCEKLRNFEQAAVKREQQLREENKELMRRLEAAEMRAETSTHEASLTTMPLMRQLESLQNTLTQRTSNWNKEEKVLLDKLAATQSKLKSIENAETKYEERVELQLKRCAELEESLSHALLQEEKSKMALQQVQLEYTMKNSSVQQQLTDLNNQLAVHISKVESLERKNKMLEEKLRTKTEERMQNYANGDELTHCEREAQPVVSIAAASLPIHEINRQHSLEQTHGSQSPALSFGRNSLEETMEGGSIDWQADDIECISNSGPHISNFAYGMQLNLLSHNTSTLEHLQSMLKQRDGELVHIQWEMTRLQDGRNVLIEEITTLTTELENTKEKLLSYVSLERNYEELQRNYDALLQMYGEKVERTEELELDLKEAREAYKTQIDELLAQPLRSDT